MLRPDSASSRPLLAGKTHGRGSTAEVLLFLVARRALPIAENAPTLLNISRTDLDSGKRQEHVMPELIQRNGRWIFVNFHHGKSKWSYHQNLLTILKTCALSARRILNKNSFSAHVRATDYLSCYSAFAETQCPLEESYLPAFRRYFGAFKFRDVSSVSEMTHLPNGGRRFAPKP